MQNTLSKVVAAFPSHPFAPELFSRADETWTAYFDHENFEAEVAGQSWDALTPRFVEAHARALRYMPPAAFARFLPAYIAALLRGESENELPELVLLQLTRRPGWESKFDGRMALLTPLQRALVVQVLEALAQGDRFPHFRDRIDAALLSCRATLG